MIQKGVSVLYKYVDGAHFFVSGDDTLPGLCVAHADLETAYKAVGETLQTLYQEQYGEEVTFIPSYAASAFFGFSNASQFERKIFKLKFGLRGYLRICRRRREERGCMFF